MILAIPFSILFVLLLIGLVIPKGYTTLTIKKAKDKNHPTWLESASYIIGKYEED
ncbi:hypothetical protein [Scytonema sp. NUACC26]|uniref:hypothetical protein n=1 Tax=Scytonema sp. NUACC26 TaxID=3140176 RepID=UPI0034DC36EC